MWQTGLRGGYVCWEGHLPDCSIRPAWRFLPCSQIRPQMWQLGKQKGGRHAQEGGAHGGPIVRKFQTKSATTKCVISSAAKHKSSTKLHTIWSHVLDRSAKVLNKLIIPCRYCTHSFTIDEFALAKYNVQLSVSYWPSGKFRRPLGRSAP